MRLQAADVVEQHRTAEAAEGSHQERHQANSALEENGADANAFERSHATRSLPAAPNTGGSATRLQLLGWIANLVGMRFRLHLIGWILCNATAPATDGGASAVPNVLALRGRHQDRAPDLRQRCADVARLDRLYLQHLPAASDAERFARVPGR